MPKHHAYGRVLLVVAALLMLLSLFFNLGVQPVYLEEPRRALIAMEMAEAGNFIVPLQLGEYYYRKPPVFNWLIYLSAQLFGDYTRWALRLPTVLSAIATAWLLFAVGRRYVNRQFGWLWPLLYLGCGAIYFYFSMLGEIDLFYSFVTLASFLSFFHFYQRGQYALMFSTSYALAAVGLLTKGLPSIPFLGLTVLAWLIYEKRWRLLFTGAHIVGILAFVGIAGGYFAAYAQYNSLDGFVEELFSESVGRTAAGNAVWQTLQHMLTFPLDTLKDTLPSSLLLLFALRRDIWRLVKSNKLITFSALIFAVNFLLYWLSPGAKQRYIYMLYPLLLAVGLHAWQHRQEVGTWRTRSFQWVVSVLLALLALGSVALVFVPAFDFLPDRWVVALSGLLVFALLCYASFRRPDYALQWLLLGLVGARLVFALTVLPQRAHDSAGQFNTDLAVRIHERVGGAPLYLYEGGRISYTVVYKLNRLRATPLHFSKTLEPGAYMMLPVGKYPQYEELIRVPFQDGDFKLVEIP
ncbi:MAG TPA: glycosyltransferase family 39 protein [Phaeodactylibacter sp.]|nr:glycosyltransferase family 39 protein [Phaeodactylibacter sp.]